MPDMKTEWLPCPLTEDEIRDYGQRAAKQFEDINNLQAEAKLKAAEYKSNVKLGTEKLLKLTSALTSGREYREIEIREEPDRLNSRMRIIRVDTGEEVRTRPFTPGEMQLSLDSVL